MPRGLLFSNIHTKLSHRNTHIVIFHHVELLISFPFFVAWPQLQVFLWPLPRRRLLPLGAASLLREAGAECWIRYPKTEAQAINDVKYPFCVCKEDMKLMSMVIKIIDVYVTQKISQSCKAVEATVN